jgi:hypothetical protein
MMAKNDVRRDGPLSKFGTPDTGSRRAPAPIAPNHQGRGSSLAERRGVRPPRGLFSTDGGVPHIGRVITVDSAQSTGGEAQPIEREDTRLDLGDEEQRDMLFSQAAEVMRSGHVNPASFAHTIASTICSTASSQKPDCHCPENADVVGTRTAPYRVSPTTADWAATELEQFMCDVSASQLGTGTAPIPASAKRRRSSAASVASVFSTTSNDSGTMSAGDSPVERVGTPLFKRRRRSSRISNLHCTYSTNFDQWPQSC